ncbi:NB-ARC domains-containing protein [Tanacetum coccineum]
MATTSISHRWKNDVFVSFKGEDIRKSFMDHLFNDFKQKGICAFKDDNKLPKGEEISPHLYKAIEESRFLIVIFSKDYASSSWCLSELVKTLECKQIENPKYEETKRDCNHEVSNSVEVGKWKEALFMAAGLSGFDLHDMTNGCFCKDVQGVSKRQGLPQVHMQIIDDVNNVEQLEALASSPDWFFPGNDYEGLELFSLCALGKRHPTEDFEEFASQIVKYLQGHPLALNVFSRLLYEKSVYIWRSELDRLQRCPCWNMLVGFACYATRST